MITAFDEIPLSFTPETIDMVSERYMEMQRNGDMLLTDPEFPNLYKADHLHTLLISIADRPNNVNNADVIKLAALSLSWVEALYHEV